MGLRETGEKSPAPALARASNSVAPEFGELAGPPSTSSTQGAGSLGAGHRRPRAGLTPGSPRAPPTSAPPAAARPAQVKQPPPATSAPLPSSLCFPGPCLRVLWVPSSSYPGSHGRAQLASGSAADTGNLRNSRAAAQQPLARRRRTSAAQSAAAGLRPGPGNKEGRAANGSRAAPGRRQSPSAARTFAARARRWQALQIHSLRRVFPCHGEHSYREFQVTSSITRQKRPRLYKLSFEKPWE
nr:translation initiation factor IF-2-like [Gorilla gorilla gorilla]